MPSQPDQDSGRSLERNRRIALVERLILESVDTGADPLTAKDIAAKLGEARAVSARQLNYDIREAWRRIAATREKDREALFARADLGWQRRERLADKRGDTQAGNYALDRWAKLHGLNAPTRVQVGGSIGLHVTVDVQLRGIIGVLDAAGLAALQVVLDQVELAKAAGKLPELTAPAAGEGDEPGEVAEDEPEPVAVAPSRPKRSRSRKP